MTTGILWGVLETIPSINPTFEVIDLHHITLGFAVEEEDFGSYIGRQFEAKLVRIARNFEIEAIEVQLPAWVPFLREIAHITVSRQVDVEPKFSTAMLKAPTEEESIKGSVIARIEFKQFD